MTLTHAPGATRSVDNTDNTANNNDDNNNHIGAANIRPNCSAAAEHCTGCAPDATS